MVFQSASKSRNVDRSKILREQTTLGQFFAGIADVFAPVEEHIEITEDHRAEVTARITNFCEEYPVYRVEPTENELELLWRACSTDDEEVVASAIYEQFTWASGEAEWQRRLRALRILKYFSQQGDKGRSIVEEVLIDAGETIRYLADHVPKCRSAAAQLVHLRRQLVECRTPRLPRQTDDMQNDKPDKPVLQNPSKISKEEAPLLDFNSDEEDNFRFRVTDEIRRPGVPLESELPEAVPSIRPQLRMNAPSPIKTTNTSIVELLTAASKTSSTEEKENNGPVSLYMPVIHTEKQHNAGRTCASTRTPLAPSLQEPLGGDDAMDWIVPLTAPPYSFKEINLAQDETNSIDFSPASEELADRTTAKAPRLDGMCAKTQTTNSLPNVMSAQQDIAGAAEGHVEHSNDITLIAKDLPTSCVQGNPVKPYLWLSIADQVELPQAEDKFAFLARSL